MRKLLIIVFLVSISMIFISGNADAVISDPCSSCHTMHSSQDGVAGTPNDNLTKFDCLGCHTNGTISGAPDIDEALAGDRTAAGTFADSIVGSSPRKVHNVRDITWTADETAPFLLGTTPGAETGGYTEPAGAAELTCAGTLGCHGNHDGTGLKGFHHNSASTAYRFLRYYDGSTHTDILGKGSADRELGGADATNHNVYHALDDDSDAARDSISSLCSMCHGDFHGQDDTADAGGGSPWQRHPTEIVIPAGWESTGTGVDAAIDYDTTPFAFADADWAGVTTGAAYAMANNPRVACISCHRAHGSDYDDLLRFNYTTVLAGGGTTVGCLACHTGQR